jgi:endonuclease YncB( thermonuclease family)
VTDYPGRAWTVDRIASITDGDTVRVYRSRVTQLGDDWYRIADANPDGTPRSVPLRLAWVDTPERGKPGWADAKADLVQWLAERTLPTPADPNFDGIPLTVVCYESAGWDRILADLRDADGNSASQWLMADRGWPPYDGGNA